MKYSFTELIVACAVTGEETCQSRGLILICRNLSRKVKIPNVEVDEHWDSYNISARADMGAVVGIPRNQTVLSLLKRIISLSLQWEWLHRFLLFPLSWYSRWKCDASLSRLFYSECLTTDAKMFALLFAYSYHKETRRSGYVFRLWNFSLFHALIIAMEASPTHNSSFLRRLTKWSFILHSFWWITFAMWVTHPPAGGSHRISTWQILFSIIIQCFRRQWVYSVSLRI